MRSYNVVFSVSVMVDADSDTEAEQLAWSDFVENMPKAKDFGVYSEVAFDWEDDEVTA